MNIYIEDILKSQDQAGGQNHPEGGDTVSAAGLLGQGNLAPQNQQTGLPGAQAQPELPELDLRVALEASSDLTAAKVAQYHEWARELGLPEEMIPSAHDVARREVAARKLEASPLVAEWATKSRANAALAAEDIDGLVRVFDKIQAQRKQQPSDLSWWFTPNLGAPVSALKTVGRFPFMAAENLLQSAAMIGGAIDHIENEPITYSKWRQDTGQMEPLPGPSEKIGLGRAVVDFNLDLARRLRKSVLESDLLSLPPELRGRLWDNWHYLLNPEWLTFQTGEAANSMAAMLLGAKGLGGGPATAAFLGGQMEAGGAFQEMVEDGVPVDRGLLMSQAYGVVSSLLNKIGLDSMFAKPAKTAVRKIGRTVASGAVEGVTEYLEEPAQAFFHGLAKDETPAEIGTRVVEALKNVDVIAGSFFAGAGGHAIHARHEAQQAQAFVNDQVELHTHIEATNTKQLSPEHTQSLLEMTPEMREQVGLPAEELMTLYQAGTDILTPLGLAQEEVTKAAEAGRTIYLPLSQLHARLDQNQFQAAANIMRRTPEAVSAAEAQGAGQKVARDTERIQQLYQDQKTEESEFEAARDKKRAELTAYINNFPGLKAQAQAAGGVKKYVDDIVKGWSAFTLSMHHRADQSRTDFFNRISFGAMRQDRRARLNTKQLIEDDLAELTPAAPGPAALDPGPAGSAAEHGPAAEAGSLEEGEAQAAVSLEQAPSAFGEAFANFTGRPAEAIEHLLKEKRGHVPGAFFKEGHGEIDLPWGHGGNDGFGLAHIIEERNNDGFDGEAFVRLLPKIVDEGRWEERENRPGRAYIVHEESEAVIRLDWDNQERTWLLTAYPFNNKNGRSSTGRTTDLAQMDTGEKTPSPDLNDRQINIDELFKNDKSFFNLTATESAPAPQPAPADTGRPAGRETTIINTQGEEPARYEVWEASDLIPSHNPTAYFAKRQDYPANVQERPYHSDRGEQDKVRRIALDLKPDLMLTNNPDALNGPPIVTEGGVVLGGNGRAMSLQLAYAESPQGAARYRAALAAQAPGFGLDPAAVASLENPVLVRVVSGEMDERDLAIRSRLYNQSQTQGLQSKAKGVSMARLVSQETLDYLAANLSEDETLRSFLDSAAGKGLIETLKQDGVIEQTQLSSLTDDKGYLNEAGKSLVEDTLRGVVVPDYDVLRATPAAVLNRLDRAVPALARLKARAEGWDMGPVLTAALRQIGRAERAKMSLDDYFAQTELPYIEMPDVDKGRPAVQLLAMAMTKATQKEVAARFEAMAQDAEMTVRGQEALLERPEINRTDSFIKAFLEPVVTVGGEVISGFDPGRNPTHAALQYAYKNGGKGRSVATAIDKLQKGLAEQDEERKAKTWEAIRALNKFSGAVTIYDPKRPRIFDWRPGQELFQAGRLDVNPGVDLNQRLSVVVAGKETAPVWESMKIGSKALVRAITGPLRNDATGLDIDLSATNAGHLISSATRRGLGGQAHIAAVRNIKELMRVAALVKTDSDRKGQEDVKNIHRFVAPMRYGEAVYAVNMLVKEYSGERNLELEGVHKLYDLKLENEAPAGLAAMPAPEGDLHRGPQSGASEISLDDLLNGVKPDATSDRLVAVHNLSIRSLRRVAELGGLAVPSIGVTKAETPFSEFGEISLIGTRDMVDPADTPVFSFDAYSTRFPKAVWPKVPYKKAQAFIDSVKEYFDKVDDTDYRNLIDHMVNRPDRDEVLQDFIRSDGAKVMYLAEQGTTFEPVMRQAKEEEVGSMSPELQALVHDNVDINFEIGDETHKRISEAYRAFLKTYLNKNMPKWLHNSYNNKFDDNGLLNYRDTNNLIISARSDSKRLGQQEVDRYATREALKEKVDNNNEAYISWATEKISAIFGSPSILLGRKKVPLNLENVVAAMKTRNIRGTEKTLTFGTGQVTAASSKRFRSMKELQAARDRVVSEEQEKEFKESIDQKLSAYRDAVLPSYTILNHRGEVDTWEGLDDSMRALGQAIKNGGTEQALRSALSRHNFQDFAAEPVKRGMAAIKAIREGVTNYFEAKPQRAVRLNEFAGAVVPENAGEDVIQLLQDAGLEVRTYAKDGEGANQKQAVRDLSFELGNRRPDILFQQAQDTGPRGALTIADHNYMISLFQGANLSTLIHETGHIFLAEIKRVVGYGKADEDLVEDFRKILRFLDRLNKDKVLREEYDRGLDRHFGGRSFKELNQTERGHARELAKQEYFARAFEAYLAEGRAPSRELEGIFARFKRWLIGLYKDARAALGVELNPEIRGVFDRLLAVESEIAATAARNELLDLTAGEMDAMGLDGDLRARAAGLMDAAREAAAEGLTRERNNQRRTRLARYEKDASAELHEEPLYKARAALRKTPLDLDAVRYAYGDETAAALMKKLPGGLKYTGTLDPDAWAAEHGFKSGVALVQAVLDGPSLTEAIRQRVQAKEAEHDAGYLALDALLDTQEVQEQFTLVGRRLAENLNLDNPAPTAYSDFAAGELAKMPMSRAMATGRFLADMKRALERFRMALGSGDQETALKAHQQAYINLEFARQSRSLAQQQDRLGRDIRRFIVQKGADPKARFIAMDIAMRHGLARFNPRLAEGKDLNVFKEWLDEAAEEGHNVIVDAELWYGRGKPWREMTVDRFQELSKTLKQIVDVERNRRKVQTKNGLANLADLALDITSTILAKNKVISQDLIADPQKLVSLKIKGRELTEVDVQKLVSLLAEGKNGLEKVEILFTILDGKRQGPLWQAVYKAMSDAEDQRALRMRDEKKNIDKLFAIFTDEERRDLFSKKILLRTTGKVVTMEKILSLALQTGNEINLSRVFEASTADGKVMSKAYFNEAMSHMSKNAKYWQFVQAVWDYFETFKKESFDLDEKINGFRPLEVEARPFTVTLDDGTTMDMRGGYYPIVYEAKKSARVQEKEDSKLGAELFKAFNMSPSTQQGHLKARATEGLGGPLNFSLGVIGKHVYDVVNDLTMREPTINAAKILRQPNVRQAISATAGVDAFKILTPWLMDTVREKPVTDFWERGLRWFRHGVTTMALGLKAGTMLLQATGLSASVAELGPKWMARGMRVVYGDTASRNPIEYFNRVMEQYRVAAGKSPFMATRLYSWSREVKEAVRQAGEGRNAKLKFVQKHAMTGIGVAQMMVDLPTWFGGYERGLNIFGNEEQAVAHADQVVRFTQGSGKAVDLSAVQRGSEAVKAITTFFSWFNTMHNLAILKKSESERAWQSGDKKGAVNIAAGYFFWAWFGTQTLEIAIDVFIRGRYPGAGDDEGADLIEWLRYFASKYLGFWSGMVPLGRDAADYLISGGRNQVAEFSPLRGLAEFAETGNQAKNIIIGDDEKAFKKFTVSAIRSTGHAAQLPTEPVAQVIKKVWDYMDGTDPEIEIIKMVLR